MDSTPLREAIIKTQLDLSGLKLDPPEFQLYSPALPTSHIANKSSSYITPRGRTRTRILPPLPRKHKLSFESVVNTPKNDHFMPDGDRTLVITPVDPNKMYSIGNGQPVIKSIYKEPIIKNESNTGISNNMPKIAYYSSAARNLEDIINRKQKLTATGREENNKTQQILPSKPVFQHSSPKGSLTTPTSRKSVKHAEDQRYRVALEIMTTEETYVQNLKTLTSFFYKPLVMAHLIPPDDLKTLFPSQLSYLLTLHSDLLERLKSRLSNTRWQGLIGDIFASLCSGSRSMDFFQLYSGYVEEFPAALEVFNRHIKFNIEFRSYMSACMDSPTCGGLDLGAFLLTPVQRLPRYLLLLKELMKYTDSSHPDSYFAELAFFKFKAYLVVLNDSIHMVLDFAAKSPPWQNESRGKNGSRSSKSKRNNKKQNKKLTNATVSHAPATLELNNTTIHFVDSCPPLQFDTYCTGPSMELKTFMSTTDTSNQYRSDINQMKAKRLLDFSLKPHRYPSEPTTRPLAEITQHSRSDSHLSKHQEKTKSPVFHTSASPTEISLHLSPTISTSLTGNNTYTDSGIYEEDLDMIHVETKLPTVNPPVFPTLTQTQQPRIIDMNNLSVLAKSPLRRNTADISLAHPLYIELPHVKPRIHSSPFHADNSNNNNNNRPKRKKSAERIMKFFKLGSIFKSNSSSNIAK